MENSEKLNEEFLSNLNYALTNLEKDISEANFLEDKIYIELTKSELINYLNGVFFTYKMLEKNYDAIINKYNEVESIVSQLELCLADYENKFHMDGISYSIYQIGKILVNIMKVSDKNKR